MQSVLNKYIRLLRHFKAAFMPDSHLPTFTTRQLTSRLGCVIWADAFFFPTFLFKTSSPRLSIALALPFLTCISTLPTQSAKVNVHSGVKSGEIPRVFPQPRPLQTGPCIITIWSINPSGAWFPGKISILDSLCSIIVPLGEDVKQSCLARFVDSRWRSSVRMTSLLSLRSLEGSVDWFLIACHVSIQRHGLTI